MPDYLEAALKSSVAKCKNVKTCLNDMTFHTDKELKSKKFKEGKSGHIYMPRMSIQKENFISKPKKLAWKRPIFCVTLIQAVLSKTPDSFTKYFSDNKTLIP